MYIRDTYDDGLKFAEEVGRMTHLDPRSVVSGIVQSHGIYVFLRNPNISPEDFINSMITVCRLWEKSEDQGKKITLADKLQWVANNFDIVDTQIAYEVLIKTGWPVTENYPLTIFMLLRYWKNPLEGFFQLVNLGGDCDSTAAMYGALAVQKMVFFFQKAGLAYLREKKN